MLAWLKTCTNLVRTLIHDSIFKTSNVNMLNKQKVETLCRCKFLFPTYNLRSNYRVCNNFLWRNLFSFKCLYIFTWRKRDTKHDIQTLFQMIFILLYLYLIRYNWSRNKSRRIPSKSFKYFWTPHVGLSMAMNPLHDFEVKLFDIIASCWQYMSWENDIANILQLF